jgi:hypothetical protein
VPPTAFTTTELPAQRVGDVGLTMIFGVLFTTIDTVPGCALSHPSELVPTTEYVVVTVGQTTLPIPGSTV